MHAAINESIQSPLFWLTVVTVPLLVAIAGVYLVRLIDKSTGATLAIAKKLWGNTIAKREQRKRDLLNYLETDPMGIPTLLLASNSALLTGVALVCVAVALFSCTSFIVISHALKIVPQMSIFQAVLVLGGGFAADLLAFIGIVNLSTGLNLKRVLKNYPGFFQGLVRTWF
jgi:hypothetical protein